MRGRGGAGGASAVDAGGGGGGGTGDLVPPSGFYVLVFDAERIGSAVIFHASDVFANASYSHLHGLLIFSYGHTVPY